MRFCVNMDIVLQMLSYFVEHSRQNGSIFPTYFPMKLSRIIPKCSRFAQLFEEAFHTIDFFLFSWVKSKLANKISKQQ